MNDESRFILGNEEYIKTQLDMAYVLILRAKLTSNKEQRVKFLLTAFGSIREVLTLLGVKNWEGEPPKE